MDIGGGGGGGKRGVGGGEWHKIESEQSWFTTDTKRFILQEKIYTGDKENL